MTDTTDEAPATETAPYRVVAETGTRLEQLHAAYPEAKAAADAAAERLKGITDGIKLELSQAAPEGTAKVDLTSPDGPPMRLTYTESWRVDARKLKAEDPHTYVRFAKKSGAWSLKVVAG